MRLILGSSEASKKPKRMRRRQKHGSYGWDIIDEVNSAPPIEGPIYDAGGIVNKMLPEFDFSKLLPSENK